jgi:carbohydrate-binding DOMON domain-containing protein
MRWNSQIVLVALCLCFLATPAVAKVLIEVEDPPNDDVGNGDYVYPTDGAFAEGGQADLTSCKIEQTDEALVFTLGFRSLVDPWRVGNRLTYVAIGIDTKKGGLEEIGHAAFAKLAAPAEYVIYYGGENVEMTDAEGLALESAIEVKVDLDANTIVIGVPIEEIGKPGKKWKYSIAAGLQDDYGGGGLGDFRLVNAEAEQWRGGGGDDLAINPNVYDVIMPRKAKDLKKMIGKGIQTQADVLGNYSLDENRLAVLPYIKR